VRPLATKFVKYTPFGVQAAPSRNTGIDLLRPS